MKPFDPTFALILQDAPPAGGEGGGEPGPGAGMVNLLVPLVLLFAVWYFLLLRPQRRQQKERDAMLTKIKKNDHVLTSGGIYGIVDKVKDDEVVLKIDEKNDVRVRVARSAIVSVTKVSGAAEEERKAEAPQENPKK